MKPGDIPVSVLDYRLDQCGLVVGFIVAAADNLFSILDLATWMSSRSRMNQDRVKPFLARHPKIVSIEAIPKSICVMTGTFSRTSLTIFLASATITL